MKIQIITQRLLTPEDGMALTNGLTVARKKVVLPSDADASVWKDITEEEAQMITRRMEAEQDV